MSGFTRRELLLSLPGLAVAGRLAGQMGTVGFGGATQVGPAPLRVLGIHSVTLAVSSVERSLDFYQALFGMPVQARQGDKVLLRVGDGPLFLGLMPAGTAPPRIDHWGMSVEDFEVEPVVESLTAHGLATARGRGQGPSVGPERVRVTRRGDSRDLYLGDPNGLVMQLGHPTHCGGSGPLGAVCQTVEPAPSSAPLALRGMSHLTINVPDPEATNEFYQTVFGMDIQAYQAASPLMGVGPGVHFLMFIGAGGRGGGTARVNHACFSMDDFEVDRTLAALEDHGIRSRDDEGAGPLRHWISMRMPNRGGAPEGTPELYFSDPDGLSIQLQDTTYCGGGGYLGGVCS